MQWEASELQLWLMALMGDCSAADSAMDSSFAACVDTVLQLAVVAVLTMQLYERRMQG